VEPDFRPAALIKYPDNGSRRIIVPAKKTSPGLPKPIFHTVAMVISDLKRSVEWYTTNFGLDVIEQGPGSDEHWIVVGRKGQHAGIHLCDIPTFDPAYPVEPGNSGVEFELPGDFEDACAALEANGVHFTVRPRKRSWGWEAQVADPDGNEMRLVPAVR
jgi:catechol 2,3-dioxygenase-like lactoylglutathione lyase family enzyme